MPKRDRIIKRCVGKKHVSENHETLDFISSIIIFQTSGVKKLLLYNHDLCVRLRTR